MSFSVTLDQVVCTVRVLVSSAVIVASMVLVICVAIVYQVCAALWCCLYSQSDEFWCGCCQQSGAGISGQSF